MTKSGWKVEADEGYVNTRYIALCRILQNYYLSAYFDINYIF